MQDWQCLFTWPRKSSLCNCAHILNSQVIFDFIVEPVYSAWMHSVLYKLFTAWFAVVSGDLRGKIVSFVCFCIRQCAELVMDWVNRTISLHAKMLWSWLMCLISRSYIVESEIFMSFLVISRWTIKNTTERDEGLWILWRKCFPVFSLMSSGCSDSPVSDLWSFLMGR